MKTIREAATDLCDRWETSLWKDVEHTSVFIHELRMALAQPEQATGWDNGLLQDYNKKLGAWFSEKPNAKQELREALAQPSDSVEQEPVAWSVTVGKDYKNCIEITHCKSDALAQYEELTKGGFESIYTLHQLYTTPPKREWVGLTVEQIEDVGFNLLPTVAQKDFVAFARYVEMLSKEKNQ